MAYTLERFPKNKPEGILSGFQIEIRNGVKKYIYGKEKVCNKCLIKQPIDEFYISNKATGRRRNGCRDCQMRASGVVEIGKQRFSEKILKKGFRRCTVCKNIKPLTEYYRHKGNYAGRSSNCKKCNARLVRELQIKGKTEITDWYVKEYARSKGILSPDKKTIQRLRMDIISKRKPKYFLNGKSFITLEDFALYVLKTHNIPITTTKKRISSGYTEQQCLLCEYEARGLAHSKGMIEVIDTVNGKRFIFKNTRDEKLLNMFGSSLITEGIKSNAPVGGKRSKYPNPCLINRLSK